MSTEIEKARELNRERQKRLIEKRASLGIKKRAHWATDEEEEEIKNFIKKIERRREREYRKKQALEVA